MQSTEQQRELVGVVFDLGNVVIDWDPLAAITEGVGEAEAASFLSADDFDFAAWNHGPDSGQTWKKALAYVEETYEHWLEHAKAYVDHFPASLLGEVPGTPDIVRELDDAGVPMWGLTNWSAELYEHAPERFEVLSRFRDVVVSGHEGVAKPDPAIYHRLADRAGHPLTSLVFVDDKQVNVEVAEAMGMDALLFTDAERLRAQLVERGLLAG
ncbi:HAD family phosphatase [Nocardioidaceae bacterium]|nr:HAD family phosphatase [Nocardioidaceae bacterium]